jgi:hypothetical protein
METLGSAYYLPQIDPRRTKAIHIAPVVDPVRHFPSLGGGLAPPLVEDAIRYASATPNVQSVQNRQPIQIWQPIHNRQPPHAENGPNTDPLLTAKGGARVRAEMGTRVRAPPVRPSHAATAAAGAGVAIGGVKPVRAGAGGGMAGGEAGGGGGRAGGDAAAQRGSLQLAAPSASSTGDHADHAAAADTAAAAFALLEGDEKHNQRASEADEKRELEPPQQLRIQTLKTALRVEEDSQQQHQQQQQRQAARGAIALSPRQRRARLRKKSPSRTLGGFPIAPSPSGAPPSEAAVLHHLLPSPPRRPVVGNMRDMPLKRYMPSSPEKLRLEPQKLPYAVPADVPSSPRPKRPPAVPHRRLRDPIDEIVDRQPGPASSPMKPSPMKPNAPQRPSAALAYAKSAYAGAGGSYSARVDAGAHQHSPLRDRLPPPNRHDSNPPRHLDTSRIWVEAELQMIQQVQMVHQVQQQQQQQLSVAMQRIHQLEALLPPEALEGLPAALDPRVGVSGALTVR